MAAQTENYVDPLAGSDHEGASFVDGSFAFASNTLTKVGAFAAAVAGDKFQLSDNGSGEVTTAIYEINSVTDDDNVVMNADIRSGAPNPTDVVLTQGIGDINDPYATLQHAWDNTTAAAGGDRFNVKSDQAVGVTTTTDDILEATLDPTTYGAPSEAAPLTVQGYTSSAGDGGIGGIDGDSGAIYTEGNFDWVSFVDMHLHNGGATTLVTCDNQCTFINCEVDDTTGGGIDADAAVYVRNCHFHNIGGIGLQFGGGDAIQNYFQNGTNDFSVAIANNGLPASIMRNIISIDGASDGVRIFQQCVCKHNSILSAAGSGEGITGTTNAATSSDVSANVIEGFSDIGTGNGFLLHADGSWFHYDFNAAFDNDDDYDIAGTIRIGETDNEVLGSSGFSKSGADTFANRFTYFAPTTQGNMRGGADESGTLDKGAVQSAAGGGAASILGGGTLSGGFS